MNLLQRVGNAIMSFGKDDLEPFLVNLFTSASHAVVTSLQPVFTDALTAASADLAQAAATGSTAGLGAALGTVFTTAVSKAEVQALVAAGTATATNLSTAWAAAVATHPATATLTVTTPPPQGT